MNLVDLDLDYITEEIKKFVVKNYGKFPEYGNKVYLYAFERYFNLLPNECIKDINNLKFFIDKVYPMVKKKMNIVIGVDYLNDTLLV